MLSYQFPRMKDTAVDTERPTSVKNYLCWRHSKSVYLGHKLATEVISSDQIKVITATAPPLAQPCDVSDEKSIQQVQKTSYGGSLGGGGERGGNWV